MTGIQTGVFVRETKRRDEEKAKLAVFNEKLDQDQERANSLLNKLNSNWVDIRSIKNPYDLSEVRLFLV